MRRRIVLLIIVAAMTTVSVGCGESNTADKGGGTGGSSTIVAPGDEGSTTVAADEAPATSMDPEQAAQLADRAALLAAAARSRLLDDNSFGGEDVFNDVVVIDGLDRQWTLDGTPDGEPDPTPLDPEVHAAVEEALAPARVRWMSSDEADALMIEREEAGSYDLVAFLYFSEPTITGDSAQIHTSVSCGNTCAISNTHEFRREADGSWTYVGSIGTTVIS